MEQAETYREAALNHQQEFDRSQSDHDLLIRVHERLTTINDSLNSERVEQARLHAELQVRITALETWKNNMSGRFAVIATVAAFAGSIVATVVINLVQDKL